MKTVGILALQGGVKEHEEALGRIAGVKTVLVKKKEQVPMLDALILPGGESTAIGKLLRQYELLTPIREMKKAGKPLFGTCCGMILLAKELEGEETNHLDLIDITVRRNAFGSQLDSFIRTQEIPFFSPYPIEMVFIRAPLIARVGEGVQIVAEVDNKVVAAYKDKVLVTSFHPELTEQSYVHEYFVNLI